MIGLDIVIKVGWSFCIEDFSCKTYTLTFQVDGYLHARRVFNMSHCFRIQIKVCQSHTITSNS